MLWAARAVTILVLWTAFAAAVPVLLGYSRIPYAAALDGHFFKPFARLHADKQFPYFSLLVMGGLSIVAGLINLEWVISAMLTGESLSSSSPRFSPCTICENTGPTSSGPSKSGCIRCPMRLPYWDGSTFS